MFHPGPDCWFQYAHIWYQKDQEYERIKTNSLAQDETRLINLYRKLDSLGKERITSYLEGYINALEAQ